MGLLDTMPAYYMLKWCSPASLSAGGFGNDQDTPLAMLRSGYSALVEALAAEVHLDARLGVQVLGVERARSGATLHFAGRPSEHCDIVVLSGPIPEFVGGSMDRTRPAILNPATEAEDRLFRGKRPMQFLVSMVQFTQPVPQWEAIEYWPDAFSVAGGVILRRDVGYAEGQGRHAIGGVQSYSYWPVPTANRSIHWASQQRWMAAHGLRMERLIAQHYYDTYLFHFNQTDVMQKKPWALQQHQLADTLCNCTMYVGGSAAFETVEDSVQHNLELVHSLIDERPH